MGKIFPWYEAFSLSAINWTENHANQLTPWELTELTPHVDNRSKYW
jgi:hypothetical protein